MATQEDRNRRADFFRVVSDPTRLAIIELLRDSGPLSVAAIRLGISGGIEGGYEIGEAAISHHLGKLKLSGNIQYHRKGKELFYSLTKQGSNVMTILDMVV